MAIQRQAQQQSGQGDPSALQHQQSIPRPLIARRKSQAEASILQRQLPQPAQQSSRATARKDSRQHHEDAFDPDETR